VEAPRKHGTYDMRWPCVWNNGSRAVHLPVPELAAAPPHLKLVRTDPRSAEDKHEREVVGTRRLIAALAATAKET